MLKANFSSIPEQISYMRLRYPQSIALTYSGQQLSYEEFDRRADQFAGYLAHFGIGQGGTVAVCMERSFDWIVAALGIMRTGATYVPLDSAWPDSRLRYAVEDSCASIIVSRAELLGRLRVKARGIDPSRDAAKIAASPQVPTRAIEPESLAYVIYTSGSTGFPKGVEITHSNLANLVDWHRDAFGLTEKDRASHLAGLGFDAAVWEIWPHLSAGATVCLADDSVRTSPTLIQEWMIRERITIGFVPTVHGARLMAMTWPTETALRFLLTGGDTLHLSPVAQLPFEVVNNYGPTECTVVATSSVLRPGSQGAPPIGRAISGASVYLLNEDGDEVPEGSVGEIYIGGEGVGRGYRNLPDLTQRYFLPDPFAGEQGARMYRTGDRGVRRSDGEIDFRGRLDRQTKIRGQRVELDEIATILARHPGVDFATATSISKTGENQLVAYVLPKERERIPTSRELQKHLLRTLPDYMIPAIFVRLHSLPLSLNGKVDLKILPHPSAAPLLERGTERAPASPIEEKLLALVRQLLSNEQIGAEDSFFLAGGHSLLGMQLLLGLRDKFGVDLTLRQLFEAPTVERLAALVEGKINESINSNSNGIFWIQSRSVSLAEALGDNLPLSSVGLTLEDFDLLGERPALPCVAACLVAKIRKVQPKGPYTIGGFCLGGVLAYEIAFQLRASGQQVPLLVLLDAPNPSCLDSCGSLRRKLSYLRYCIERAARLGIRRTYVDTCDRLYKACARIIRKRISTPKRSAHRLAEAAACVYQLPKYDGNVLLLLASDCPPHVNLVPGWQSIVTGGLHIRYLDTHHSDLLKADDMRCVAQAIVSHSDTATSEVPLSRGAGIPDKQASVSRILTRV
jgi:amino acid adenylation domain-containing protein